MIYNKYKGIRGLFNHNSICRKTFYFFIKPYLLWLQYKYSKKTPLFTQIEIETINRCNGSCSFCPVNKNEKQRPFAQMTEELFDKIVTELGEMEYKGKLALFSNNEPFLDKRIVDFAKKAREKVPNAFIHIYTNGTLLDKEKVLEIIPYLDQLIIDNYSDKLVLNNNIKEINDLCSKQFELNKKICIHLRLQDEKMYTRGGQSPNNKINKTFNYPCLNPYKQFVIRPDGKVSLCCNDALGRMTMGDCNKQGISEIWYEKDYQMVRKSIYKGRNYINICKYCNTFSTNWI